MSSTFRLFTILALIVSTTVGCADKSKFEVPSSPSTKLPEKGDFRDPGLGDLKKN
jgi:hypothetical protein